MRSAAAIWGLASALAIAAACGDEANPHLALDLPSEGASAAGKGGAPASAPQRVAVCDGAPDGIPCGEPGSGKHCVFDVCAPNECGDGVRSRSEGEECDDGNERDGDGCDANCRAEPAPGCGNGRIEPGEECDDGNREDDDRCTSRCTKAFCGDRIKSRGEECDDGNASDADACTTKCKDPASLCGNRRLDGAEQCDDGNDTADDGCENDCKLTPPCGNGALDEGEDCDDGNDDDEDDCQNDCTLPPPCGNGRMDPGEQCDDGNTVGGDTCLSNCRLPPPTSGGQGGSGGAGGTSGSGGAADGGMGGAGQGGQGGAGQGGMGGMPGGGIPEDCMECRKTSCRAFPEGEPEVFDVFGGCYEAVNGVAGANTADPTFLQQCIDVVECAYERNCAYDSARGPSACYCGSRSASDCAIMGPAGDAPCIPEWTAAARAANNAEVVQRFSGLMYPSGWAFGLLSCDLLLCNSAATGDCVP